MALQEIEIYSYIDGDPAPKRCVSDTYELLPPDMLSSSEKSTLPAGKFRLIHCVFDYTVGAHNSGSIASVFFFCNIVSGFVRMIQDVFEDVQEIQ